MARVDDMDFDAALLDAQNCIKCKVDMVMAGVTVTGERLKVMDFSVYTYGPGIQSIILPLLGPPTLPPLTTCPADHRHPAWHHRLPLLHR